MVTKFRPIIFVAALALAAPLLAMGGGGGGGSGGSSGPSESVPKYDPAVEYQKGMAALKVNDFKAAKTAFDRVISVAPKDGNTQYLAGMSRAGLNDWKGATKNFEKATKFAPDLIRAWQQLGVGYMKTKAKPKAEGVLAGLKSRAAKCATSCPQATELAEAVKAVEAAIGGNVALRDQSLLFASTTAGDTRYLSAVSLINEGRYEIAITELHAAQTSFGPHPDILTYLGFANRKLKRFDAAEAYYREALAVAPTHRGATEYFGELMVERGNFAGAKQMLAKLDAQCRFGCAESEELRAWIVAGRSPHSS